MNTNWSKREKWASASIGTISMLFLYAAIFGTDAAEPVTVFLNLGASLSGFSAALSPQWLFERFRLSELMSREVVLFGGSALCAIGGVGCFALAAWFWLFSNARA